MIGAWLSLALVCALGENRLWWAELALEGPVETVELDCGVDGGVRLRADLLAGERRRLRLPLPMRAPLGTPELAGRPLPEPTVSGAGSARFLGWSDDQPADAFARLPPALRARSLPPATVDPLRASPAALCLLGGCLAGALALRRRSGLLLCLALTGAGVLGCLPPRSAGVGGALAVLEVDLEAGRAYLRSAGEGRLALPAVQLEVTPARAPLRFELRLAADGVRGDALAAGARLAGIEDARPGRWSPAAGPAEPLADTWVRRASGAWTAHGPWAPDESLPPARGPESGGALPPGWLASGLVPGRGVLVGRSARVDGRWVRVVGFADP